MSPRKQSQNEPQLNRGSGKSSFLYRQLADLLRHEIETGALKPGDMLPSMDDLAEKYKINKATVRQSIADLMSSGMVFSVPAKGTFVSDPSQHRAAATRRLSVAWISTVNDSGNTGRYHTEIMDAVREHVQAMGGHLLVFSAAKMTTSNFYNAIGEANLDGAVVVGPPKEDPMKRIILSDLPVVMIDDRLRSRRIDSIMVDNEGGGYLAVEHLASLGHRRIGLVISPRGWQVTEDRLNGALGALKDAGLSMNDTTIIESDFTPEGGRQAGRKIAAMNPRPTGVFFFNDEMAAGALQAIYEVSSLRVPQDLSVVGFDDISWAQLAHPQLTTVHVEKDIMGREAVQRLYQSIEDHGHLPTTTIIPTRLVIRKSTGAPPA
jgi:DNA-binding LacI/PurR family transcriptional regulator